MQIVKKQNHCHKIHFFLLFWFLFYLCIFFYKGEHRTKVLSVCCSKQKTMHFNFSLTLKITAFYFSTNSILTGTMSPCQVKIFDSST